MNMEIAEYFNGVKDVVDSVYTKHPELKCPSKGRQVLEEVKKILPYVNPDTVLRAARKLRSPKDKDYSKEREWREYFS